MKRTWMLGAAVLAGALGLGATQANAAQFGVYVGARPAAYVPPCPGPGYQWVAGFWSDGYWMPGRWAFVGARGGYDRYAYMDYGRVSREDDRDRWDRDRDGYRDRDRDSYRDRDRGGDRGWNRGDDHDRH
jgi:hypothetical protein